MIHPATKIFFISVHLHPPHQFPWHSSIQKGITSKWCNFTLDWIGKRIGGKVKSEFRPSGFLSVLGRCPPLYTSPTNPKFKRIAIRPINSLARLCG